MGIHGFSNIYLLAGEVYKHIQLHKPPNNISGLYIDLNSILYNNVEKVKNNYVQSKRSLPAIDADEIHSDIIDETIEVLGDYYREHKPSNIFAIFVDGTAPDAKINQQRRRRYMTSVERSEYREISSKTEAHSLFELNFNTEEFSPGTVFMSKLTDRLKEYLGHYDFVSNTKAVIFSPDTVPGEGEHKLMSMFRNKEVLPTGSHVIVGADSDIAVLACIQPIDNIYIFREGRVGRDEPKNWIDINTLKIYISDMLDYVDEDRIYLEFMTMISFMGNDFIPTPISMMYGDRSHNTIKILFECYKILHDRGERLFDLENDQPDLEGLKSFEGILASREESMIEAVSVIRRGPLFSDLSYLSVHDKTMVANSRTKFKEGGFAAFTLKWRDLELTMKEEREALPQSTGKTRLVNAKNLSSELTSDFIVGIFWTSFYYTRGVVNNTWVYPGNFAPLFTDMAKFYNDDPEYLSSSITSVAKYTPFMTIPQQLFCIMPQGLRDGAMDEDIENMDRSFGYDPSIERFGLGNSHIYVVNCPIVNRTRKAKKFVLEGKDKYNATLLRISETPQFENTETLIFIVNKQNLELVAKEVEKNKANEVKTRRKKNFEENRTSTTGRRGELSRRRR